MTEPTNADLLVRLARLEDKVDGLLSLEPKVDALTELLAKASGVWFFSKLVGGLMMSGAILWSTMHGWWTK